MHSPEDFARAISDARAGQGNLGGGSEADFGEAFHLPAVRAVDGAG